MVTGIVHCWATLVHVRGRLAHNGPSQDPMLVDCFRVLPHDNLRAMRKTSLTIERAFCMVEG